MSVNKKIKPGLVQIQIVNYVNWESTITCIRFLKKQTYNSYRLIVIENASPNDSIKHLREFDPDLSILVSDVNVGWGAGLNLGFFHHGFDTNPEFYLTLNSDVTLEPDCLSKLVTTMKANPNCAAVAPIIYEDTHQKATNNVGFNLTYKYLLPLDISKVTGNHKKWVNTGARKVSWVSDTVALMRKSAIYKVGGYDEQYFMYGQMTDMGYRLKKQGYDFIVNYKAVAYHKGKGSSGEKLSEFSLYYKLRNWCIFQRKSFGKNHMPYILVWSLAVLILYTAKVVLQGESILFGPIFRGIMDGLSHDLVPTQHKV